MTRRDLRTNEIQWRATPRVAFRAPTRAVAPNRKRRTFFARVMRALVNLHA